MHLVYGAQISTVHSFCANLLRTYAAMADLAPDFRVMEEQESRVMKADVMEDLLEHIYANLDKHENIKAFIEELAFGRDDSAVPAITYGVYDTVQSHPWRMEWVKQCLSNMDVRKFSDAAETPWGKYLIDNAKSYIRSQLPLVELAIELCEADEALSAAYTETLQADYRKLFDITCAVTWNDMVVAKDVAWGRLTISAIRIPFERTPSRGVIPSVRPTVPTADAVSNRHSEIGRFSATLITIPPISTRKRYIIRIVDAFFNTSWPTLCPLSDGT